MKTISDLKSIFDMFPHKSIDQGFTFLINGKVDELKYTILDSICLDLVKYSDNYHAISILIIRIIDIRVLNIRIKHGVSYTKNVVRA